MIFYTEITSRIGRFWQQHPALLYGLVLLIASYIGFGCSIAWIPLFFLFFPLVVRSENRDRLNTRLLLSLTLFFTALIFIRVQYSNPPIPAEGLVGIAHFQIDEIKPASSPVVKRVRYIGKIKTFQQGAMQWRNLPAEIRLSEKNHLKGDQDYYIQGKLIGRQGARFLIYPKKSLPIKPVPHTSSWAEKRYSTKLNMQQAIKQAIPNPRSASFLSGLFTGLFDDPFLMKEFQRFGLQHILAISGFHFSIVAWLLSCMIRIFCPHRIAVYLILSALTSYFLFLGSSPSILRAWLMAMIFFASYILGRKSAALNSLGIALIVLFFFDPLIYIEKGFKLSFAITASILFFFSPVDRFLARLLKERPYSELSTMDGFNQHAYLILCLIRQALSLMIAVQIAAAPLILLMTGELPLFGLVYNLFFPFLVSISLFLLITALILPPISTPIHLLNSKYTAFVLSYVFDFPKKFDMTLSFTLLTTEVLIFYLTAALLTGVFLHHQKSNWSYI